MKDKRALETVHQKKIRDMQDLLPGQSRKRDALIIPLDFIEEP